MAATACSCSSAFSPFRVNDKARGFNALLSCSAAFNSNLLFNYTPTSSRLRISHRRGIVRGHVFRIRTVSCLDGMNSEASSDSIHSNTTDDSSTEATVDLKLPRRRLLVHFTCNSCGERTKRLINRLAYERGTVFVQCAGCDQHHKLIDNLGLVVEYDFREDSGMEATGEQH